MYGYGGGGFRPYVPVAERQAEARRKMEKLKKKGQTISPVTIAGRTIAGTFWGKAWWENLERYSDYSNRLPRGRTYVRNGSVIDLQIGPGQVKAMVSGSSIYNVTIKVTPVGKARWKSICQDCSGAIDSLVELLQGRLSKGVMERICHQTHGLFPSPKEINLSCSCPDWADMCKPVAAVLYGVGARLDQQPELLFRLNNVDEKELIASAGKALPMTGKGPAARALNANEDLAELFGLDIAQSTDASPAIAAAARPKRAAAPEKKPGKKKKKTAIARKVALLAELKKATRLRVSKRRLDDRTVS